MELTLADEMFLLGTTLQGRPAIRDLPYLVAGAALADLAAARRIDAPQRALLVRSAESVGDPVLDALLARMTATGRPRTPWRWVFDEGRPLLRAERSKLVDAGLLGAEHDVVLGVIPRTLHPVRESGPHEAIVARVRDVVLGRTQPDPRTRVLVSLLGVAYHARRTARELFPEIDAPTLRDRLQALGDGHWVTTATANAVRLVRATRSVGA